jgi:hypothetical protein
MHASYRRGRAAIRPQGSRCGVCRLGEIASLAARKLAAFAHARGRVERRGRKRRERSERCFLRVVKHVVAPLVVLCSVRCHAGASAGPPASSGSLRSSRFRDLTRSEDVHPRRCRLGSERKANQTYDRSRRPRRRARMPPHSTTARRAIARPSLAVRESRTMPRFWHFDEPQEVVHVRLIHRPRA